MKIKPFIKIIYWKFALGWKNFHLNPINGTLDLLEIVRRLIVVVLLAYYLLYCVITNCQITLGPLSLSHSCALKGDDVSYIPFDSRTQNHGITTRERTIKKIASLEGEKTDMYISSKEDNIYHLTLTAIQSRGLRK